MAIRFAIGLYAFVALAVLILAACGGGDDAGGSTTTPLSSAASTGTPAPATSAPCLGGLHAGLGPVAFIGFVESIVLPDETTFLGTTRVSVRITESLISDDVQIDEGAFESSEVVEVVVQVQPVVARVGDCVRVAGFVGGYACGPACDAFGFVAIFFEVIAD